MRRGKLEIYAGKSGAQKGRFRWRFKGGNGEPMASGEGFTGSGLDAVQAFGRLEEYIRAGNFDIKAVVTKVAVLLLAAGIAGAATISQSFSPSGGASALVVGAPSNTAWSSQSSAGWVAITAGGNGSGDGSVSYSVAANTTTVARSTVLSIAGVSVPVLQSGVPCVYGIAPTSATHGPAAGGGAVSVTAGSGCSWAAAGAPAWAAITSGGSGTGSGAVNYTVAENTSTASRSGTIIIAGQTFGLSQGASAGSIPSPGSQVWGRAFGGLGVPDTAQGYGVAADGSGNVVFIGSFTGTCSFGGAALNSAGAMDVFVAKYAANGTHQWSKRFGSLGSDIGHGVAVDSGGNVYVVGEFLNAVDFGGGALASAGSSDIFLVKLSPSGDHIWSKRFGGTGADMGYAISSDGSDNLAITGSFGFFGTAVDFGGGPLSSAGQYDVFAARFSATGAHLWSKRMGGTGQDRGYAIATGSNGDVAVTGYFSYTAAMGGGALTSAGSADVFVTKFSANGDYQWSKRFGGISSDYGYGVAIDGSGNVALAGNYRGLVDFGGVPLGDAGNGDMFLAKYSSSGAHLWSKRFGESMSEKASAVATDAAGNILFTGSAMTAIDFGGGWLTGDGSFDVFVAKFSPTGAHVWSKRARGTQATGESANAVAANQADDVLVTGAFASGINFGAGPLSMGQSGGGFLVELAP